MKARRSSESGFTLMELLVSLGISGVLAATSIPFMHLIKSNAYTSAAVQAQAHVRPALEIAASDSEESGDNNRYWFIEKGPGKPSAPYDSVFEGLNMVQDVVYYVDFRPFCATSNCLYKVNVTQHCKNGFATVETEAGDGAVVNYETSNFAFLSALC